MLLSNWAHNSKNYSATSLEFGHLNNKTYLLVAYSEGILLFDVARAVLVSTSAPPAGTKFTRAVFSVSLFIRLYFDNVID